MDALHKLNQLTSEQIESLSAQDFARLFFLDKEVEMAFGAKERSFGALHADEHGCRHTVSLQARYAGVPAGVAGSVPGNGGSTFAE